MKLAGTMLVLVVAVAIGLPYWALAGYVLLPQLIGDCMPGATCSTLVERLLLLVFGGGMALFVYVAPIVWAIRALRS